MKRWKKILGGTLVVLVAAGAGTAWQFRNEIQAMQYFLSYSPEQQQELEQENEKTLEAILEQANLPADVFGDPSLSQEELEQKLKEKEQQAQSSAGNDVSVPSNSSGQASGGNGVAISQNGSGQAGGSNAGTEKPGGNSQQSNSGATVPAEQKPADSQQTYDAELAAMVGEIYALRTSFTGQLDGLLRQAKSEYAAMSPTEWEKNKKAFVSKYIGLAGGLESSCDSQMEEILGRIESHLKKTGGNTALVKEIRKVYENEKALKKSSYMEMLR